MTEQWMRLGNTAIQNENYKEAYDYFSKVVEEDPNNWMAIFLRGKSLAWQTKFGDDRINELTKAVEDALNKMEKNNYDDQTKNETIKMFARSIYEVNNHFFEKGRKLIQKLKETGQFKFYRNKVSQISQTDIYCGMNFEAALKLLDNIDDEDVPKLKLDIKKSIVWYCHEKLRPQIFLEKLPNFSFPVTMQSVFNFEQGKELVKRHDELIIEIRRIESDFKKSSENNYLAINRLKITTNDWEDLDKYQQRLEKLQEKIDKQNELKEKEYQQKLYWEQHPEEYKSHLIEEEKRKKEELEKQRIEAKRREEERKKERKIRIEKRIAEIEAWIIELEENVQKSDHAVDQLKKERENLGMFSLRKKKGIDNKLLKLEENIKRDKSRIESFRKELLDLEEARRS